MQPALRAGDLLLLAVPERAPRPGDVVVVRGTRGWRVHRVIVVNGTEVLTRGDACINADPPARVEDVLHVVTRVRRGGREFDVPAARAPARVKAGRLVSRARAVAGRVARRVAGKSRDPGRVATGRPPAR